MDLKKKANYLRLASTEIIEQALKDAFAAGLEEAARMMRKTRKGYTPEYWARQFEARAQAARK